MRTWRVAGVHGLPASVAASFHRLTTLLAARVRTRSNDGQSPSSGFQSLPEITFDLSFLSEPPPAGLVIAAERAPSAASASQVDLPDITFDLSSIVESARRQDSTVPSQPLWRERSLEDWFRQRAAEVAQRALERRETSPLDAFVPLGHAG